MTDLLLPRTDSGVAIQLAIFSSLSVASIVVTRRRREWLILVIGITLVGLGLFGVRAVH